jgi:hypothetical protein
MPVPDAHRASLSSVVRASGVLCTLASVACACAAIAFFCLRIWHGVWFISFNDEAMHLLGGRFLDAGGRLYKGFVDLHGPGIFMFAQAYGALFGWSNGNYARLVPAALVGLSGIAVALSPALGGVAGRAWALALFYGLTASVWLVQGLYLFSYQPVSAAFLTVLLASSIMPPCYGKDPGPGSAAAGGIAAALAGFCAFTWLPSIFLWLAAALAVLWRMRRFRSITLFLAGLCLALLLLAGWLFRYGDPLGYLIYHFVFGLTIFTQTNPQSPGHFLRSLVPGGQPQFFVQDLALACVLLAAVIGWRRTRRLPQLAVLAGVLALNLRGSTGFQNGAFLVVAIACFSLTVAQALGEVSRTAWRSLAATALVGATMAGGEMFMRQALSNPTPMTRAEMLRVPPIVIARSSDAPLFRKIRELVRPNERMLALVYRPDLYWAADRLPIDGYYMYSRKDAIYARSPWLGRPRDLCVTLRETPPPVIVFDDWQGGDGRPEDYMPCVIHILEKSYLRSPDFPDLYVRQDRAASERP